MKVETSELLSIGRFAGLSGLTVKALRHYEAHGAARTPSSYCSTKIPT